MPDDAALIQRAQSGDAAAFAEIYDRYQPPVYRYIYHRVGSEHAAEDLTAEVFVRMVEKIYRYAYRGRPLLAWLYTIARNLVADHHRQRRQLPPVPLDENMPADTACPEEAAAQRWTQQELTAAIAELTEEQRMVILCKFVEGLDNEAVARLMGKPSSAVKSLQHRALAALRRALEPDG